MPFPENRIALATAGYSFVQIKQCKCGVEIEMWRTPKKRQMPLHFTRTEGVESCVPHFADCPHVEEFRRPK